MAFGSGFQNEIGKVGAGEIIGDVGVVSSYTTFEDGLKGGLFAKYNSATDGVELIDGSATPVIAGVVKREIMGAIEDAGTYNPENSIYADVIESGVVTVATVAGLTNTKFQPVYVSNQDDTNDGKATNVAAGNVVVDAYFYEEIDSNVWSIRLK
jgi:hypothetical protein